MSSSRLRRLLTLASAAASGRGGRGRPIRLVVASFVVALCAGAIFFFVAAATNSEFDADFVPPGDNLLEKERTGLEESQFGWSQRDRLETIKDYCRSGRAIQPGSRKAKDFLPLVVDPEHRYAYCHVPKAASTAWMRAMAALVGLSSGEVGSLSERDGLHKEMLDRHSVNATDLRAEDGQLRFVFVRHPFSRLVSAYHDKFVTRRERSFYQPLLDYKEGALTRMVFGTKQKKAVGISFPDFVDFVVHEINSGQRSYGSLHWLPAARLCHPCAASDGYNFVGKLETLSEDVAAISASRPEVGSVAEGIFARKWNSNEVRQKDRLTERYLSQLSSQQTRSLKKAFLEDFEAWGYRDDEFDYRGEKSADSP